jgi:hypothetical protein
VFEKRGVLIFRLVVTTLFAILLQPFHRCMSFLQVDKLWTSLKLQPYHLEKACFIFPLEKGAFSIAGEQTLQREL